MKQAPNIWGIQDLTEYVTERETLTEVAEGRWEPARPLGFYSLENRLKAAWLVFTGRADALLWNYRAPDENLT